MATAAAHDLLPLLTSWPFASLLSFLLAVAATVYLHSRRSDGDTAEEKNAVTAALTGFLNSFKKSAAPRALPRSSYPDKVVLVTGANTGLGYGIALRLAELQCTVIVACRSNPEETAASLRAASGNPNVSSAYVDLSDVRSVHGLADALLAQRRAIDCAVLNAAVLTTSSNQKSKQQLDQQYAVNAVANAVLVQRLSKSAAVSRFVLVSSEAHRWAKPSEIDATLHGLKNPPPYTTTNAFDQYSRSKLMVMTWMCGAARDVQRAGVQLAAVCPGAIASNIARHTPYLAGLVTFIMKMLFPSPYKASAPVVWMALADALPVASNQPIYYQHLWQAKPPSAHAMDAANGARVYSDMNASMKSLTS